MGTKEDNKISVIVPVYNVEDYLDRCISSLTGQTLNEIQIILVDDGSVDKSGVICDSYVTEDSRIKIIHKENEGQGIARNTGLKEATGKYICFLDSDDYLDEDTFEMLYEIMEGNQADLCTYGYSIHMPAAGSASKVGPASSAGSAPTNEIIRTPRISDRVYEGADVVTKFVPHFFGDDPDDDELRGFSSCMSCFRNDIIKENEIRFPSEREYLSEDTVFCLEYCKHVKRVFTTSAVFYHYCQNGDSFSQGYMPDKMPMTMKMHDVLKGYAAQYGIEDIVKTRLSMYVWVNLMAALKQEVRHADDMKKEKQQLHEDLSDKNVQVVRPDDRADIRRTKKRIQKLCMDSEICEAIRGLKKSSIPLKQKVLLTSFLNKDVPAIVLMCRIRSSQRL